MDVKQNISALSGHPQHRSQFIISRFEFHRVSRHFNSRDYDSAKPSCSILGNFGFSLVKLSEFLFARPRFLSPYNEQKNHN